jgi:carbonic anhydrase
VFVANALYQQELAKRREVISVDEITTPEAALAEMEAGNDRFVRGMRARTLMTAQDPEVRTALTKGQSPFAVVVTCSDSRTADSLIFDQELGRVFTIRAAGNSPDILGIASIEYAVDHLGSKVVIIMGHTKCGAVGAVADAKGEPLPDNLYIFQQLMAGLLEVTPKDLNETVAEYKDRLQHVNAARQAQIVYDRSRVVRELVDHGKLWLLPASYDLATGKVTFMNLVEGGAKREEAHHH